MLWSKSRPTSSGPLVALTLALVLCGTSPDWAAERVSLDVDLESSAASDRWVLPPKRGVRVSGGELVLDTVNRNGVRVFLRKLTLNDLTLSCKILVESKGPGVRAFEACFHSAGVASHQFVHVNRGVTILGWVSRESLWNPAWPMREKRMPGSTSRSNVKRSKFGSTSTAAWCSKGPTRIGSLAELDSVPAKLSCA